MKLYTLLVLIIGAYLPTATAQLMQAVNYHDTIAVNEYWISEKLDGIRARWDGEQYWSKNGNLLSLPNSFYIDMPDRTLDGELWISRQQFGRLIGLVKSARLDDPNWQKVQFCVFDMPLETQTFSQRLELIHLLIEQSNNPHISEIRQWRVQTEHQLMQQLEQYVQAGAEGLMLHHQDSLYRHGRSQQLIKLKRFQDAEARVIGIIDGKGKFAGMLGAILVKNSEGKIFKIGTGFSIAERQKPPQIGEIVTYRYTGFTDNGIPRFASFLRMKEHL